MARKSLLALMVLLLATLIAAPGTSTPDKTTSKQKVRKATKTLSSKHESLKTRNYETKQADRLDFEKPPALARHLKRFEAIPGNGGQPDTRPGTAEDEAFMEMAYPDTDIPVDRINTMRAAFTTLKSKGFKGG